MALVWHMRASFSYKCPTCGAYLLEGNPVDDCPLHQHGQSKPRYDPIKDGPPENLAAVVAYLLRSTPAQKINELISRIKGN